MANKNSLANNLQHRAELKRMGKPVVSGFNSKTSRRRGPKVYKNPSYKKQQAH